MGALPLLSLLSALAAAPRPVKPISNLGSSRRNTYIVAHQDDWQLFMGDVAVERFRKGAPATFIYLTAGDDGRDSVYWQTRERAALASVRVASGTAIARSDSTQCRPVVVMKHTMRRCVLGNTESYFLRLPDGQRNGSGFSRHNNQSLRRLRVRKISAITAVDGSATYQGWNDFVSTVAELVSSDSGQSAQVHTTDPSVVVNPHDHFDHRIAGLLVAELRKNRSLDVRYYVGYALGTRAPNRSNAQARDKTEVFLAYDQEMMRGNRKWSAYSEHPRFYTECMMRTYVRTPREQ
ncbi:MAG TPA: PIG-L family deacetylase [Gemmatimonadaceae bacterium]|nr:PIG-L family deacetylase [Gemmatimonadaceae bacterium]